MDWKKLRRHRHFKIGISTGIAVTTMLAIWLPHMAMESAILNTLTNLIWVWEDSLE